MKLSFNLENEKFISEKWNNMGCASSWFLLLIIQDFKRNEGLDLSRGSALLSKACSMGTFSLFPPAPSALKEVPCNFPPLRRASHTQWSCEVLGARSLNFWKKWKWLRAIWGASQSQWPLCSLHSQQVLLTWPPSPPRNLDFESNRIASGRMCIPGQGESSRDFCS